jgi:hypothetical protein
VYFVGEYSNLMGCNTVDWRGGTYGLEEFAASVSKVINLFDYPEE